jgi:hypothetical protein
LRRLFSQQNVSTFKIERCHWDGVYKVILVAQSKAGQSEEADESIKLGNGYADYYYEGAESGILIILSLSCAFSLSPYSSCV